MNRFLLLALAGLLAIAMVIPATVGAAKPAKADLLTNVPVSGLLGGVTSAGTLTITEITRSGSQLLVDGTLTIAGVTQTFTNVAASLLPGGTPAKCDILFLDLGPIFLDLLGLTVDLSAITLDINAVPGPGNLLGNLLCAVAGLLDGGIGGLLDRLLGHINRLLG